MIVEALSLANLAAFSNKYTQFASHVAPQLTHKLNYFTLNGYIRLEGPIYNLMVSKPSSLVRGVGDMGSCLLLF